MPKPATSNPPESATEAAPEAEAPRRKRGRPAQDANEGLRRALIEQSARLFREKGYGNTTVRDIAAATGVHAGSWFYWRFWEGRRLAAALGALDGRDRVDFMMKGAIETIVVLTSDPAALQIGLAAPEPSPLNGARR